MSQLCEYYVLRNRLEGYEKFRTYSLKYTEVLSETFTLTSDRNLAI